MKFCNTLGTGKGEGNLLCKTDVKGRRLGERIGLETLVALAENNECHRLEFLF
jgi:hypothetical protein